jgi:hypothetical protein
MGPDDLQGPVPVAVAGRPKLPDEAAGDGAKSDGQEPRLVVFGDSDFASNELIGPTATATSSSTA